MNQRTSVLNTKRKRDILLEDNYNNKRQKLQESLRWFEIIENAINDNIPFDQIEYFKSPKYMRRYNQYKNEYNEMKEKKDQKDRLEKNNNNVSVTLEQVENLLDGEYIIGPISLDNDISCRYVNVQCDTQNDKTITYKCPFCSLKTTKKGYTRKRVLWKKHIHGNGHEEQSTRGAHCSVQKNIYPNLEVNVWITKNTKYVNE